MPLIICPGVHDRQLTENFLQQCNFSSYEQMLIYPSDRQPPYCARSIVQFLRSHLTPTPDRPLMFISFSAGTVGAIAAAWTWQQLGGTVKGFIAFDGWGVPLFGTFPIHRISHDYFTHWSSALLGQGGDSFYADPPVEHLHLWSEPSKVCGYQIAADRDSPTQKYTTAAKFTIALAQRYLI